MMSEKSYYFGNPQLYKMPAWYREPLPDLTPSDLSPTIAYDDIGVGVYQEDSLTKAIPFIAGGIALLVVYNILRKR